MDFTLSYPCSRSDLLLSCQGAALSLTNLLYPHDLVFWRDGSDPFPLGKNMSADPVCSHLAAETCAIQQALRWSRQHQRDSHFSSLFLLSDFPSVLATLSSVRPSFRLTFTGRSHALCPPLLSSCNELPVTNFFQAMTLPMSW